MTKPNETTNAEPASALTNGLEGASATKWPRAYQTECQRQDGYNWVHGRPHGFAWKPLYRVTVEFESKEEAQEFFESLHEGEIVPSNA